MANYFLPFLYGLSALFLLFQAARVMSRGFLAANESNETKKQYPTSNGDRTGQITIHPEILNQEGDITDEDLLTVRFSDDDLSPESLDSSQD